jgi:hypothetical protein
MMRAFITAAVAILVLAVVASAQSITSGPQPGQKVPGPFAPLHATGPDAGQRIRQYCKNGVNPVAMVFVREVSPAVTSLIKKIDVVTAAHRDAHMGSFVTFLNDAPELPAALKQLADQENIRTTILCVAAPAGPPRTRSPPRPTSRSSCTRIPNVKANYAFRKGELNEQAADAIVRAVARITPAE